MVINDLLSLRSIKKAEFGIYEKKPLQYLNTNPLNYKINLSSIVLPFTQLFPSAFNTT